MFGYTHIMRRKFTPADLRRFSGNGANEKNVRYCIDAKGMMMLSYICFQHYEIERMKMLPSKSKCDAIVDDILAKVVNRVYAADDRLPNESELCEIYGVSRVTVRESLKKLEMMDVISIQQGRGTFVKGVGLGNFMQPMFNLIDFGDFDISTIYEARLFIETGTCRLAAKNRTEEDLKNLQNLVDRMAEIQNSGDEISLASMQDIDTKFHIHVALASKNEILKAAVINLENISSACAERINKSHAVMQGVVNDHMRILEAIRASDADEAERVIAEHTLRAKEFLG
jgi:GntR family transcriptional repressor for pyruvate dehydrogenase complex